MNVVKTLRQAGIGVFGILITITRLCLMGFRRISRLSRNPKRSNGTVWILGNGPSCHTIVSLETLPWSASDDAVMAVNHFSDSRFFEEIKPSHYIISAPELLWLPEKSIKGIYVENRNRLIKTLSEQVTWKMDLLLPAKAMSANWWKAPIFNNSNITVKYYSHLPIDGPDWFKNLLFGLQFGLPRPHNVVIPGIMTSIWMGFKEINLLGVEHSWIPTLAVDDENEVTLNHQHFYDETPKINKMFYEGKRTRKLHEVLEKFYYTFRSYWEIRYFSDKAGVKITNFTPSSFIDAFPKKKL
jgi:hypothetical protein